MALCSLLRKFAPGTVLVVFDVFNDTGLDGIELCSTSSLQGIADASIALRLLRSSVLMDIAQEGGEVSHVVDWL